MEPETPPQTTIAALARAAERFGAREAVVDGETRMDFQTLQGEVYRAARALIVRGLQPRERVAVWAPNTCHWIVAALAIHHAGATIVPINTRFTGHEALDVLQRSEAAVLMTPDSFLETDRLAALRAAAAGAGDAEAPGGTRDRAGPVPGLPALRHVVLLPAPEASTASDPPGRIGVETWQQLLDSADGISSDAVAARCTEVTPDHISDILFTSGTTGRSKGATSTHRQAVAVAAAWADCGELRAGDRYLVINPFFHSFGYKAGILVGLLRGATLIPQSVFDAGTALRLIERERITVLPGPPTIYQSMLTAPERADVDTSSLRLAVTGAAMVPVELIERMQRELSFDTVLTAYGLTEAVVATMCRPDDDPETISRTSGRATAGFEVRVVDWQGSSLPPGEDGEVWLRGPNVMQGYLDDPMATAEAVDDDGWLRTGDVGRLDDRGYLTLTDRLKDVFTTGGFNVYPAEIEQTLARVDGVAESAVVGVPHERLGEVGRAFVVLRPGAETSAADIRAFCQERLAGFKVPRHVEPVDELPRNAGGKVLKRRLRELPAPGNAATPDKESR